MWIRKMGMVILVVAFGATDVIADVSAANIVGYSSVEIRKGFQTVDLSFADVSTGEQLTLATLLPSAVRGDKIMFKGAMITAAPDKDGQLHWMSKGLVVDNDLIPAGKVRVRYLRIKDQKTTLTISGAVQSEWYEGGEEMLTQQTPAALVVTKPAAVTPASAKSTQAVQPPAKPLAAAPAPAKPASSDKTSEK